jgi:hypothetical protein
LRPMPLFLLSTHKQSILSHFIHTQQHYYVSLKTLYPGGIWTRVFLIMRRMRCPVGHAASAKVIREDLPFFVYYWPNMRHLCVEEEKYPRKGQFF